MAPAPSDNESRQTYLARLFEDSRAAFLASSSDSAALDFFDTVRWDGDVRCPRCGSSACYVQAGRSGLTRRWRRCRGCSHQFSTISGTPLSRERIAPSELVLAVSIASHFRGQALAKAIAEASSLSLRGSQRLALALEDLCDEATAGADTTRGDHLRSSVASFAGHPWAEPSFRVNRQARRSAAIWPAALLVASVAVVTLVAWGAGAFTQVTTTRWMEGDDKQKISTERRPWESFSDWHQRHHEKVNSIRSLMSAPINLEIGNSK